ncbi:hypothetical protein BD560DRAFT_327326 [Blakeslea trispora]|nr:hypothetical protein BD560DRAFT_327326 [Blakeslea trispora]
MFEPTIKYKRVNESSEKSTQPPQDISTQMKPVQVTKVETSEAKTYDYTFEEEKDDSKIEIDPNDKDRIIITLSTGKKFSADRYCPHAGADLSCHGKVGEHDYSAEIGPILMCSIHYWEFALEKGGKGGSGLTSIHACPMDSEQCQLEQKKLDW